MQRAICVFFALISLALQSCAFVPQKATLAPTLNVADSSEGHGIEVGLRVLDGRTSKKLGRRATGLGPAAKITTDQDVAVVIKDQVIVALQKKGFHVKDFGTTTGPQLTVELQLLEYSTVSYAFSGDVHVKGELKAVASRAAETYEENYSIDQKRRAVIQPTAGTNEKQINQALSEILTQLVEDAKLTAFLAR